MAVPFLDADQRHPITLPDGTPYTNTVWLGSVIDHPNIEVGDFTYYNDFEPVTDYAARIAPYLHPGAPERLIIGKFCQFANGTRFITSSADHPKRWFTSYPFAVFDQALFPYFDEEFAKGADTVIGNDVWVGDGARIMPGVTLGDGVIVGAGAIVTRDVPSWSIVAGNPGRVVRRRFPDDVCDRLDRLAWWDRDLADIRALVPVLASADLAALDAALAERGL
ncbi:antibiotic acetyltransferase [Maritimibacter sp. DP07]|uniref:Antibiotic acetyltransferase n=1 Tax=Maritimibacter harenae TaxID=2606218 RepID=A0A845M572_9RHOB|nr:CatB-related O-acetyltransferase [Maritimibacter harenae]MZR15490.1 antibiotic acetyltransferase [Maritimibacter harenae]